MFHNLYLIFRSKKWDCKLAGPGRPVCTEDLPVKINELKKKKKKKILYNMFHYRDRSPEDLRHKVSRQHDTGRSDDSADDSDSDSDRVICSNFPLGEEIFPFNFAEIYPYSSI